MRKCILALESDKTDIYQLQRAFRLAGIPDQLTVVRNLEEALCYLKGVGIYGDRDIFPFPTLILLDVVAPACGGFRILEWLQSRSAAPLVIATGQYISAADAQRAYDLGANAVFSKPGELAELSDLIKSLHYVNPAADVRWLKT